MLYFEPFRFYIDFAQNLTFISSRKIKKNFKAIFSKIGFPDFKFNFLDEIKMKIRLVYVTV